MKKKPKKENRLAIVRETLRILQAEHLRPVAGGQDGTAPMSTGSRFCR